jgi:hypothetical protein
MMIFDALKLNEINMDPDWVDIGNLPSNFYPYAFKALKIRPFTVKHLRLLSKAVVQKNVSYQIQAVNQVITEDVFSLTIGDYFYVLEWLKIHSTTKTPLAVEWHCPEQRLQHKTTGEFVSNDPISLRDIAPTLDSAEYKLVPCGTHNTELLHLTNLEVLQLPEEGWEGLPAGFDFPRVAILNEVREALADPELNMIVGAAQWIAAPTLADKFRILEAQANLDMFTTAQAINETVVHGIKETSTLHCRTCGAEHDYTISIDSVDFFR